MDHNTVSVAEIKRRGMSAIADSLRRGPVHIIKRNTMAADVLSESDYLRLTNQKLPSPSGMTAVQWLLAQPTAGKRSKNQIDADLKVERAW